MKSFILVLLFQFVTLIVVSQPVSRLNDVDATDITNYEAHRYPRTLKSKHPSCRINQYFDVDKGDCMGVIGGGKALYINNKKSCGSNVLRPHCTNPRYYYICRQNKTILAQCPQNRHFESHLQKCILVPREKHISATSGQNSDIFDSVQHLDCLKTGSFPVPDNCGLFYTCSMHGKKMNKNFYTCPKNMAYDTETEMCKPSSTCREPESLPSCRNDPWDGKKENMALKEAVFPIKRRSETCETMFTNEEDATTNSTSENDDEIMLITTSYTEPFVSELTRSGDSNDIVTTTERALEKSRFTNTEDFAIPITATYSTIAVENTYPTEFNLPIEVNGNKELESTTVAGPFENGHTRIIMDDPEEQSPDDQDRTAPTILDDPSMLENIEREKIPGSENPSLGKQYSNTEEFNEEPTFGIRNIDTEPITLADPTSLRSNEPITNLDSNKPPLEIPIDDPTLQNQHSTTKAFNEESINRAENTLPIITEDVTAPSRPEEQPTAEIIPTESPAQMPIEEPNLENQHGIQEESSEKPITENESMNIAPTISEDPVILNNVEAKEEPTTPKIPIEPSVQIPISEDPNLADQYKAPENLSEESTTETENINSEEIIVGDPTTLINTEPVTQVVLSELPVINPTTENPELPIPETENINTEPTTLINTETEEEPTTKVISDESPVGISSNENSALPITDTENDNTEPTILPDPTTLINKEPEGEPAKEVVLNELPVVNPTTENPELPIPETENINTEPTTLINTEPQEEPETKVISDETPVGISSKENSALPITDIENNTDPQILTDSTSLTNTEPEKEPAKEVVLNESPVGIPSTENPELPIPEIENTNTEPTMLTDPTTLINTEPEGEPAKEVVSNESPVVVPTTENSELPITEIENTNTESAILPDPTTLINTEPEGEPAKEVVLNESPVNIPTTENPELPIPEIENINTVPTMLTDPTTLINTEPEGEPAKEVVLNESPVNIPTTENPELPIPEIENINTVPTMLTDPTTLINTEPEGEPAKEVVLNESPVNIPTTENPELPIPETENINTEPTTLINTEPQEEPATKVISDESPIVIPTTENSELPITEIENINTEPTTLINTEPEGEPAKEVVLNESPVVIPTTENSEIPIPEIENINTEPTVLTDSTTLVDTKPQEEPATKVISDETPVGISSKENSALPITDIENNNTDPPILTDSTTLADTEPEEEPVTEVISDESPVGIPSTENPELPIPEIENINTEPTTLINTEPQEEPATKVISDESPVVIPTTENSELPITEIENINTEPTTLPDPSTPINTEPEGVPEKEVVLNESPVVIPTTENPELPTPEIGNINTEPTTLINTEPEGEPAKEVVLNGSPVGIPSTENPELPIPEIENINTEPTVLTDSTTLVDTIPQEEPATKVISDESPVEISSNENSALPITDIENNNTEPTILPDPTTLINTEPEKEPTKEVVLNESPVGIPSTENPELPIPEIENINTEPTMLTDPTTLINTEPEGEPTKEVVLNESPVNIPTTENPELPIPEIENINTEPTMLTDPTTLINTEPEGEPTKEVVLNESPVNIPTTENPELPIPEIENINTEPTMLTDPTTLINTEPEGEPAKEVVLNESPVNIPTTENPELSIPEIKNINTEPTSLINTEPERNPAEEVVLNESPVVIPTTENSEIPTPEVENINNEPTVLTDSTTLVDTGPEEEPVTEVISDESPVGISSTENPELPIPEIENINTESAILPDPTTLANTEPERNPAEEVVLNESPVGIPSTENSELPITEIENINTEPTTLMNTEPEGEPAKEVVLNESPVVVPTTENSELPITEIENTNTESAILPDPTTLINTEPEGEPAKEAVLNESPVGIPSTENPELPIPEIENINTEPTMLTDPTTLINTEPEGEPTKEVVLNESPVNIPTTENPELSIPEIKNINTEPTTLINTEPEGEPAKEVVLNGSPVGIPSTENPELPIPEIENINTEPTVLTDSTTLIDTEPDEVTEVILDKSPVGTSATENPSLEKEYNNILTNSITPDTTKPQEQPITYIIPTESFSEIEDPEEPILEVERTVTGEFTEEPTIGTEAIGTTSAILPDALISDTTVPREINTGTEADEPLLETSRSEESILHGPPTTPVLNDIITATKEDPEHNNKGSDEQIPIEYGNGESSNYDLNRMITTDPTSLISTNGKSVLQNDSETPKINTEETFSNVITEKPDSRAMKKHSKPFHKHSQIIDKEDACNNVAQKESATTPKDIHMPSAIYYTIDKIKQCLTKILNMLHH